MQLQYLLTFIFNTFLDTGEVQKTGIKLTDMKVQKSIYRPLAYIN